MSEFVRFKFCYTLSRRIPFTKLPDKLPNVEFLIEDNSVTGFNLTFQKSMELREAQGESDEYAYLLSDLISINSHKYTLPSLCHYEAIDSAGVRHFQGSLTLMWDVEGAPANLEGINVTDISTSTRPHMKEHISYLAKSIVLKYEHFVDHSIIEAFKIIEESNSFPSYYKYFALRNVLAHSPVYFGNTIKYFKEYFDEKSFDYLRYEPEKRIIILNLHSAKTQKKLSTILKEFMGDIETYLSLQ